MTSHFHSQREFETQRIEALALSHYIERCAVEMRADMRADGLDENTIEEQIDAWALEVELGINDSRSFIDDEDRAYARRLLGIPGRRR